MPEWMPQLLLFVFATHLPFFAWRYHRTRERRHGATALTFALLTLAYGLRVFAPEASWAGVSLHRAARVPALLSAIVSLALLARHQLRRRPPPRSEGRAPGG
jgi:peptidoglycan/LPS O-acetylase OafA/YrhL